MSTLASDSKTTTSQDLDSGKLKAIIKLSRINTAKSRSSSAADDAFDTMVQGAASEGPKHVPGHDVPLQSSTSDLVSPPPPPPPLQATQPTQGGFKGIFSKAYAYDANAYNEGLQKLRDIVQDHVGNPNSKKTLRNPMEETRITTRPVTGFTIFVRDKGGLNAAPSLSLALRLLTTRTKTQQLAFISRRQKFHERPGVKRRRLRTARWTKKFKRGFVAAVERVQELKNQGW
ncbi:hypothetical protein CDD82_3787 [Ophiocordyceps australis]|uniref:Ribosomal protein S21 n=1 Tax=Ophiocordyceps australis TaxID=1399860 RepID=A0A2C5Z4T2_9HYPO|nr:hypothetical protein CDD82_3787 [Ophiocordyceps australis]